MPLNEYVTKHNIIAETMWKVDPDARLIGVGEVGEWNETMLCESADKMNLISENHRRSLSWMSPGSAFRKRLARGPYNMTTLKPIMYPGRILKSPSLNQLVRWKKHRIEVPSYAIFLLKFEI
jgi:hypothetical protein